MVETDQSVARVARRAARRAICTPALTRPHGPWLASIIAHRRVDGETPRPFPVSSCPTGHDHCGAARGPALVLGSCCSAGLALHLDVPGDQWRVRGDTRAVFRDSWSLHFSACVDDGSEPIRALTMVSAPYSRAACVPSCAAHPRGNTRRTGETPEVPPTHHPMRPPSRVPSCVTSMARHTDNSDDAAPIPPRDYEGSAGRRRPHADVDAAIDVATCTGSIRIVHSSRTTYCGLCVRRRAR